MVVGQLPYAGDTPMGLIFKHVYEPPPEPRSIRPGLPPEVEAVVMRGLAKKVAERFASAGDLARALRRALTQSASLEAPAAAPADSHATPRLGTPTPFCAPAGWMTPPRRLLMEETVPVVPHFVGRAAELAAYGEKLQRERLVILTGMAGVGKSTLAAKLAREAAPSPEHIFWFTFDPVEKSSADAMFWALAAFLERRGDAELWRYLAGEIAAEKPLDRTVRVNLLLSGLSSGDYVLCFDDFQVVKEAPEVIYFFKLIHQRLVNLQQSIPARLIVAGREVPPEMEYLVAEPLHGFSLAEAAAFVAERSQDISIGVLDWLWQRTEGNAKLLELSLSALAAQSGHASDIESFVSSLARRGDIRDYLMANNYTALQPEEQSVVGVLSVLPVSLEREGAEELLESGGITGVAQRIDGLVNKHVLSEVEDDRIHMHSLVREYVYQVLDRKDRDRYHQCAAEYYQQRGSYLAAAHHHFERRAYGQTLDLLTGRAQAILGGGGAGALLEQLARFERHALSSSQQLALLRARGEAHQIRGEYQAALAAFELALGEAATGEDRAELQRLAGNTHLKLGQYDLALEYFAKSLRLSEAARERGGLANAHHDLGWACYRLGRFAEARAHFDIGWHIAHELGDKTLLARIGLGLGLLCWKEEQLEQAREYFEDARRTFRSAADRVREAYALGNLGLIHGALQDSQKELSYYQQALQIQEQIGDVDGLRLAYNNLGDLYFLRGDCAQAIHYYAKLAQLSRDTGHRRMLCLAHSGLADAHLACGDLRQALDHALSASRLAPEVGAGLETGISWRVLGDVRLALGDAQEAAACFVQSLPLLEDAKDEEQLAKARRGLEAARSQLSAESSTHT